MPKLCQIIAVEKNIQSQTLSELTESHKLLQKDTLLKGLKRVYRPRDDEGEKLPEEEQHIQVKAHDVVNKTSETLTKLFDLVATKDHANCEAKANIIIDNKVLLENVPVSYLLFLEKKLVDLHTFIKKLPVLDAGETWIYDNAADCYATVPVETMRSKKVPRNHVKAEATDNHPAQVEMWYEDVVVGYWRTTKFSGALPASKINEYLRRVEVLQAAVKFAREEANSISVKDVKVGAKVFNYLFG